MRHLVNLIITFTILFSFGTVQAAEGDPAAGKAKATLCAACHGPEGISMVDLWPNLAGQKKAYLEKQIKAFRDEIRLDPTMLPMVKPLSDQDIKDLAAYFSGLE